MSSGRKHKFAVVPKETNNPFYEQVQEGCHDMTALHPEAECIFVGPDSVDAEVQAAIVRDLISTRAVDGISLAVIDERIATELANEALNAQIPFITFDSDAPESSRLLYVGTDNFEFGQSLAKVLVQLSPRGGVYGIIDAAPPNVALRSKGVRFRLQNTRWRESPESPKDCLDSVPLSIQHMYDYTTLLPEVNAIISVGGWPMRNQSAWKEFVDANRNMTLNIGDTDPGQLDLLSKVYVDGLVGQVPYQMGAESIRLLLELVTGRTTTQTLFTTSLVEVVRIPISLPPVVVNENRIGSLQYLGFIGVGITCFLTALFMLFTAWHRKKRVIKASQPLFLFLVGIGVIIMVSSIIPLSIDDLRFSQESCNVACMSFPWLVCMGFAIIFSALYSKTWRINKIFLTHRQFVRQEVSEKAVCLPFASILLANAIVLSLWTALAPLEYSRQPHVGTDDWNRIISTYGSCNLSEAIPYAITLAVLNVGLLVVANFQAYRARSIQSEFSESMYIGIVMAGMLQTCLIGMPTVILVSDKPPVVYLVVTLMILFTCLGVAILIFVPKIYFVRHYSRTPEEIELSERSKARPVLNSAHFYENRGLRAQQLRQLHSSSLNTGSIQRDGSACLESSSSLVEGDSFNFNSRVEGTREVEASIIEESNRELSMGDISSSSSEGSIPDAVPSIDTDVPVEPVDMD